MSMFPDLDRRLDALTAMVVAVLSAVEHTSTTLNRRMTLMAKTLDEILATQAAALDKITAMKTVDDSIAAIVTAQKQTLTDLRQQLADAIAANDPAKLQAVADNMDAINAALDAAATAEAAVANTPAA